MKVESDPAEEDDLNEIVQLVGKVGRMGGRWRVGSVGGGPAHVVIMAGLHKQG